MKIISWRHRLIKSEWMALRLMSGKVEKMRFSQHRGKCFVCVCLVFSVNSPMHSAHSFKSNAFQLFGPCSISFSSQAHSHTHHLNMLPILPKTLMANISNTHRIACHMYTRWNISSVFFSTSLFYQTEFKI